ncbi:hypothetical protein LINGRAHAP2_LOCUS24418 [Linum grandiflorum]
MRESCCLISFLQMTSFSLGKLLLSRRMLFFISLIHLVQRLVRILVRRNRVSSSPKSVVVRSLLLSVGFWGFRLPKIWVGDTPNSGHFFKLP